MAGLPLFLKPPPCLCGPPHWAVPLPGSLSGSYPEPAHESPPPGSLPRSSQLSFFISRCSEYGSYEQFGFKQLNNSYPSSASRGHIISGLCPSRLLL